MKLPVNDPITLANFIEIMAAVLIRKIAWNTN